jgi:hypothetical protein
MYVVAVHKNNELLVFSQGKSNILATHKKIAYYSLTEVKYQVG